MTWYTDDKGCIANEAMGPDFRPLTPTEETARAADEAARWSKYATIRSDIATLRGDNALKALIRMTPAQIDAWCNANITDLASARNAIRLLARAVSVIAREQIDA